MRKFEMNNHLKLKAELCSPNDFGNPNEVFLVGNSQEGYFLELFYKDNLFSCGSPYYVDMEIKAKLESGQYLFAKTSILSCTPFKKKSISLLSVFVVNKNIDTNSVYNIKFNSLKVSHSVFTEWISENSLKDKLNEIAIDEIGLITFSEEDFVNNLGKVQVGESALYITVNFMRELIFFDIVHIFQNLNFALTFIFNRPVVNSSTLLISSELEVYCLYKAPLLFEKPIQDFNVNNLFFVNFTDIFKGLIEFNSKHQIAAANYFSVYYLNAALFIETDLVLMCASIENIYSKKDIQPQPNLKNDVLLLKKQLDEKIDEFSKIIEREGEKGKAQRIKSRFKSLLGQINNLSLRQKLEYSVKLLSNNNIELIKANLQAPIIYSEIPKQIVEVRNYLIHGSFNKKPGKKNIDFLNINVVERAIYYFSFVHFMRILITNHMLIDVNIDQSIKDKIIENKFRDYLAFIKSRMP